MLQTNEIAGRTRTTDAQLVARLRQGDSQAFTQIHARYRRPLLEFARRRLGARGDEAEDILQEAMVRAYRGLLAVDREVELRPWLYRVVHNRVIDELRRPVRFVPADVASKPEMIGWAPSPLAATAARDELAAVVADVLALPTRQREALVGQAVDGVPHEELARRLGTTTGGSKALVNRARGTLQAARSARAATALEAAA